MGKNKDSLALEKHTKEFTYLSLLLISSGDKYVLPELLYILREDDFLKLVQIYGGGYIRIPCKKELIKAFTTAIYYYHVIILKQDSDYICEYYKINKHECKLIRARIKKFEKHMKKYGYKIPKEFSKSNLLSTIGVWLEATK